MLPSKRAQLCCIAALPADFEEVRGGRPSVSPQRADVRGKVDGRGPRLPCASAHAVRFFEFRGFAFEGHRNARRTN